MWALKAAVLRLLGRRRPHPPTVGDPQERAEVLQTLRDQERRLRILDMQVDARRKGR